MKKIVKFGLLTMVVAMVFSLAACSGGSPGTDEAGAKTFIVATDTTFKPFEFENEKGEQVGIDIDLLDAIAKDQGFSYDLKVVGFDAALGEVTSGQSDAMIAGMSITDERKEVFDFSDPYFDSGVVMAIAADNNNIKTYADLKGKKVAIKNGTEGATFAESIKAEYGFETISFPIQRICMKMSRPGIQSLYLKIIQLSEMPLLVVNPLKWWPKWKKEVRTALLLKKAKMLNYWACLMLV